MVFMYKRLAVLWKKPENLGPAYKRYLEEWRKQKVVERVEKPTRLDRARSLGYKAKQGFVIARVRVKMGGRKRPKPSGGRVPKKAGRFFTTAKSKQWIGEEKVARKFPNLEVLNSYWVGEDGTHKCFEAILVDRAHPAIKKDRTVRWISSEKHRGRTHRGLTSAGKHSRGLKKKGKGSEKTRPSLKAKKGRGK